MVSKSIFGADKAVVLDSRIYVSKSITDLESKVVDVVALIKNLCYWQKGFPGDFFILAFKIISLVMLICLIQKPKIINHFVSFK